jgi:hypothetical protein
MWGSLWVGHGRCLSLYVSITVVRCHGSGIMPVILLYYAVPGTVSSLSSRARVASGFLVGYEFMV